MGARSVQSHGASKPGGQNSVHCSAVGVLNFSVILSWAGVLCMKSDETVAHLPEQRQYTQCVCLLFLTTCFAYSVCDDRVPVGPRCWGFQRDLKQVQVNRVILTTG